MFRTIAAICATDSAVKQTTDRTWPLTLERWQLSVVADWRPNSKGARGSGGEFVDRCVLCGDDDPDVVLMPHSEDYSQPFLWTAPAMYWLCRHCHLAKLHTRFLR